MQAPRFWFTPPDKPAIAARLLSPLGKLYAWGAARRLRGHGGVSAGVPVICIGNLNAGGAGKTPAAIAIALRLRDRGLNPHIVSRGYGGRLDGPVRVLQRDHNAQEVGDEPLLLAAFSPTWVARDRARGALAACAAGADVVLLDDGFQNPSVISDLSLIVVDAAHGFGNGRVLPAGPLREPVATGLARADLILSIGDDRAQSDFSRRWSGEIDLPHLTGQLAPLPTGMEWNGLRVLAFAGIGHPDRFFATMRGLGADLVRAEPLSDHQPLTEALMTRLLNDARAKGAQLVTTEKDAVRLPPGFRRNVLTVPVRLEVADWSALDAALDRLISATARP